MPGSDDAFLRELREAFRLEAEEHLQALSTSLQELERLPGGELPDAKISGRRAELLERIYRDTHTLKGASRAVDAGGVEAFCQVLEEVISSWKRTSHQPPPEAFEQLRRDLASLRAGMASQDLRQSGRELDLPRLQALKAPAAAQEPTQAPPRQRTAESEVMTGSAVTEESTEGAGTGAETGTTAGAAPGTAAVTLPSSVRVPASRLEDLILQLEELTAIRQMAFRSRMELDSASDLLIAHASAPAGAGAAPAGEETISFRDVVERLTTARQNCVELEQQLAASTASISSSVRRFLLLPAASLLDQLHLLVRDLARTTGKEVTLETTGGDVRLDRRILEDLKDILIHLLRNAVDHGLESRAVRLAAGKPAAGRLSVALKQETTGLVSVRMEDDGSGVDSDALRRAAVRNKLLSPGEADLLSPAEALQLMFRSDVSTSAQVTEVSGRGVGMAIVREKVNRLGGTIRVETTRNAGTVFSMSLPAMRTTFRGVVVSVGGQEFVLPSLYLARALLVNPEREMRMVEGHETILLDGEVLPLARLGDLVGVRHTPPSAGNPAGGAEGSRLSVLVVSSGGRRLAVAVDALGNEEEILPRPLGPLFAATPHFESAAVTGSGRMALVLAVSSLIETAGRSAPGPAAAYRPSAESGGEERTRPPALLVADDSVTSRMLLKNVLEASGFLVDTAIDGADAWARLQGGNYDAVVSDVEMPRLNGFDLTARIRADRRLAGLPVILVTALASAGDRERGIEAGASAYIVKSGFDQANLIDSLRSLV